MRNFESSCFTGNYITGDVDEAYLDRLERTRGVISKAGEMSTNEKED
jgi:amidophosphoribosyltransferase